MRTTLCCARPAPAAVSTSDPALALPGSAWEPPGVKLVLVAGCCARARATPPASRRPPRRQRRRHAPPAECPAQETAAEGNPRPRGKQRKAWRVGRLPAPHPRACASRPRATPCAACVDRNDSHPLPQRSLKTAAAGEMRPREASGRPLPLLRLMMTDPPGPQPQIVDQTRHRGR